MNHTQSFYSGASGLIVPPKRVFPEHFREKSRLCYYATLFNSIEINSSFYKCPMASTVEKWAKDVPDNFQFTFKLLKDISHAKRLQYNPEDIGSFIKVISGVGEKKGCLLVQFPPSFSIDSVLQLNGLLEDLGPAREAGWRIAIEFRNRTWYQQEIYDLLESYNIAMVLHDMPSSPSPLLNQQTGFVYLRFHGPNGGYRGSYSEDFLYEYSAYIKEWISDGKVVYVYFNNTMGDAFNNLLKLNGYIT